MRLIISGALVLLLTSACSHKPVNTTEETTGALSTQASTETNLEPYKDIDRFRVSDPEGPKVEAKEFEEIPNEINPLVEKWVAYFQGRGREHMERYLSRSTRYEKLMKKVLRDNSLPEDLFYIALIESGFSSAVTSKAAAVGYWQFIRGTGKRYGLQINQFEDERRDPVFATQAAADYFKGLYSMFDSWYLAMASYNVGENRVKREVNRHYTKDFWTLAKKRRLPKETINYVPKFIAARMIAKNPEQYGFTEIDYLPPIEFDHIDVDKAVNLKLMAEKLEIPYEDIKALNPKWKGEVAIVKNKQLTLRIPPDLKERAIIAAQESVVDQVQFIADSVDSQSYRVRAGETLYSIAKRYKTSVAYLRDLNDFSRKRRIRKGMTILVPERPANFDREPEKAIAKVSNKKGSSVSLQERAKTGLASEVATSSNRVYIVQNGDSLFTIAQRYATSVMKLQKINNIKKGKLLKVGMRLVLPPTQGTSNYKVKKSRVAYSK